MASEQLADASQKVLKQITALYESGLPQGPGDGKHRAGGVGLLSIANHPALNLGKEIRKPRKKISVMIIGNHSAGKSSFINWYIGERVCKTGVAIETRGFIFCTSGRRRETLTGDATVRYFDYLADIAAFDGLLPNLFTEVSTSLERSFACVDFVDSPGLVDGDMKYPFEVEDSICWLADHVDLILVFMDPIGQATCRRVLNLVERLNQGSHVEKIHYFMSKADEVESEADRQRVLIQITQNLATRIRNSHAFNLPTFYLPHEDGLPCTIPNAIEDVCKTIDKTIDQTVQKNLRQLRADCDRVIARIAEAEATDAANKEANAARTLQGLGLTAAAVAAAALLITLVLVRAAGSLCGGAPNVFGGGGGAVCESATAQHLAPRDAWVEPVFVPAAAACAALALLLLAAARALWRHAPVLSKREQRRLDEFREVARAVSRANEALYEAYFATISQREER